MVVKSGVYLYFFVHFLYVLVRTLYLRHQLLRELMKHNYYFFYIFSP